MFYATPVASPMDIGSLPEKIASTVSRPPACILFSAPVVIKKTLGGTTYAHSLTEWGKVGRGDRCNRWIGRRKSTHTFSFSYAHILKLESKTVGGR